jgi:mannose-6-phosphate isomerase-like protein (cupin superfamily)
MKHVSIAEVQKIQHGSTCAVTEYSFGDPALDFAVAEIQGRYPETGRTYNERSAEAAFVLEGSGQVVIEEKEVVLQKGDAVLIQPGEKFCWQGNLKLLLSCTPAWSPEQYKESD